MVWLTAMVAQCEKDFEAARVESVRCDDVLHKASEAAVEAQHRYNLLRELLLAACKLQEALAEGEK